MKAKRLNTRWTEAELERLGLLRETMTIPEMLPLFPGRTRLALKMALEQVTDDDPDPDVAMDACRLHAFDLLTHHPEYAVGF